MPVRGATRTGSSRRARTQPRVGIIAASNLGGLATPFNFLVRFSGHSGADSTYFPILGFGLDQPHNKQNTRDHVSKEAEVSALPACICIGSVGRTPIIRFWVTAGIHK
jgi:hypothetical protein